MFDENNFLPNNLKKEIIKEELIMIINTFKDNIFMTKNIFKSVISDKTFLTSDLDVFLSYFNLKSLLVKDLINVKFE